MYGSGVSCETSTVGPSLLKFSSPPGNTLALFVFLSRLHYEVPPWIQAALRRSGDGFDVGFDCGFPFLWVLVDVWVLFAIWQVAVQHAAVLSAAIRFFCKMLKMLQLMPRRCSPYAPPHLK